MQPDNNKVGDSSSALLLLEKAEEVARSRNYSRDFALYVMYRQAINAGDTGEAAACMDLLEREVMNALADPLFGS
jgi:hypothetical protein